MVLDSRIKPKEKWKVRQCKQCGKDYQRRGNAKYCSDLCLSRNDYESNMLKPNWRLNKLMAMAKNRARAKEKDFNLDLEFLVSLWESNGGCCELTGIPFELGRSSKGVVHPYAPSIDRIVPEDGYTIGNVRLVVYQMNVALSEFGQGQFEDMLRHYLAYNSGVAFN